MKKSLHIGCILYADNTLFVILYIYSLPYYNSYNLEVTIAVYVHVPQFIGFVVVQTSFPVQYIATAIAFLKPTASHSTILNFYYYFFVNIKNRKIN